MIEAFIYPIDRILLALRKLARTNAMVRVLDSMPLAALLLTSFTVFWNFPSYDLAFVLGEESCNWAPFFLQVEEPFTDHSAQYPAGSHARNLGFRFVPASLLHLLGLRTLTGAVLFQIGTQVLLHGLLYALLVRLIGSSKRAFFYALPICLVASGHSYASDFWGFFDTLALCFLLAAALLRRSPIAIPILLLAYFTDERALVASPALLILELQHGYRLTGRTQGYRDLFQGTFLHIIVSWMLYVLLRVLLSVWPGLETGLPASHFFFDQLLNAPAVLYHGLEGFIILLAMAITLLHRDERPGPLWILVASLVVVWAVAISVYDKERSMVYLLPHIIVLLALLQHYVPKWNADRAVLVVMLINLLYSDVYPLPAQIYRMINITGTL